MHVLIAHVFLVTAEGVLIVKRTPMERGKFNIYPNFWDLPGGKVQSSEMPRAAAKRECFEETGLQVKVDQVIWEDSTYDSHKATVFTRLVYRAHLSGSNQTVRLDLCEHSQYRFINTDTIASKLQLVPYLQSILINSFHD